MPQVHDRDAWHVDLPHNLCELLRGRGAIVLSPHVSHATRINRHSQDVALAQDARVLEEVLPKRHVTLHDVRLVRRDRRRHPCHAHVLGERHERRLGWKRTHLLARHTRCFVQKMRRRRLQLQRHGPQRIKRLGRAQVLQQHGRHIRIVQRETRVVRSKHTHDMRPVIRNGTYDRPASVKDRHRQKRLFTHKNHTRVVHVHVVVPLLPCLDRIAHKLRPRHNPRMERMWKRLGVLRRQKALIHHRYRLRR